MSAVPSRSPIPPEVSNPLASPPLRIDPSTLPTYEQALDQDLRNIGLYRAMERARRLRGVTDPIEARGIEQTIELLGDDQILQRYGQASEMLNHMRRMPRTRPEAGVRRIAEIQGMEDEESPAHAFAMGLFAGVLRSAQDLAVSAYEVAGTVADVSPQWILASRLFGTDVGDALREIARNYRESVMSGEEGPSEFIREMNIRANRNESWGVATGELISQALPSLGVAMRSTQAARRAMNGVLMVYGTWSAGHGIEKYRRETIAEGRQPNAAVAALVGLGYGAAEIATEKLDAVIPWQTIATGTAHRVGEAILAGNARTAARYIVNSTGYAVGEGIEEVLAGELQSFVDAAAGVESGRTPSERLREFSMGAAGSGIVSAAGIALPSFREAMTAPPTLLRSRGLDVAMAEDARAWLASDAGRKAAIPAALSRGVPRGAASGPVDVDQALNGFRESLRRVGVERGIEAIPESERTPSMERTVAAWRRRGIEVIPIRPDHESPIPASPDLSQPGVVMVEMTGTGSIDDVTLEVGLIAHEAFHHLRQSDPGAYSAFVEAAYGPLMAAARQYVNAVQAQGLADHAGMLLESPDVLIEEGGALLFQQMIEHAGMTSTLSGYQTGMGRRVSDFAKRAMSRLGLKGKAAQATLRAVEAMKAEAPIQPVQPPADVLAGVKPPRFAVRPIGELNEADRIERFSRELSTTLRGLEGDFEAHRLSVAIEFERALGPRIGPAVASGLKASKDYRTLRKRIGRAIGRLMKEQAKDAQAMVDAQVTQAIERGNRLLKEQEKDAQAKADAQVDRAIEIGNRLLRDLARQSVAARNADRLRRTQLDVARMGVATLIRQAGADVPGKADLVIRTMNAKTSKQFERILESLRKAVGKAGEKRQQRKDAERMQMLARELRTDEARVAAQLHEAKVQAASSALVSEMERSYEVASGEVTHPAGSDNHRISSMLRNLFTYGQLKPQGAAMYLFGEGTGMKLLYRDLFAAANRRLGIYQADTDHLAKALDRAGFKEGSIELAATSAVLSRSYGLALTKPGSMFHVKPIEHRIDLDNGSMMLTSAERMTLLGLLRHTGSRTLIAKGTTIKSPRTGQEITLTRNDIAMIEGTAPAWELAIVEAMQERYDGPMAGLLRDWSNERMDGDVSEESYWPRKRELEPAITAAEWSRENMLRMGLLQSKTMDREKPILLTDAFADYLNHSWRIASLSQLEEPTAFAREALSAISGRASELGAEAGIRYFAEMLDRLTLEGMGHPGLVQESYISTPLMRLRNNLVRGFLGLNPRVALYQVGGLASAASRIDASYLSASMAHVADGRTIDAQIRRNSPYLWHRLSSNGIGLVSESAAGSQSLLGFRGPGWLVMRGISWMDHMVVRSVWVASKMKMDAEHGNLPDQEREVMAAALAEQIVVDTQPSFDVMHQSGVAREASRNAGAALLTMFTSQFNAHLNLVARDAMAFRRQGTKAFPQLARSMGYTVVGNSLVVAGTNVLIDAIISGLGGEGGDERNLLLQFADQMQQNTFNMFYGGGALSLALSKTLGKPLPPGSGMSPPLDTLSSSLRGASTAASGIIGMLVADNRADRNGAMDRIMSGLDQTAQGVVPMFGVPVTPYRLTKRIAGYGGRKRKSGSKPMKIGTSR